MLSQADIVTLSKLLDEAMELPEDSREAWIRDVAGGSEFIKAKLRELLDRGSKAEAHDFLSTLPKLTLPKLTFAAQDGGAGDPATAAGGIIGPYRLLREIGRGGMSTVWLAVRTDEQIKRTVALKLPHVFLKQQQFAERFARERDILAELTHPNIARLYDAGVTDSGQPFLALEYIDGVPVTEYCDRLCLPLRSRIDLFLQILQAVQYAHSRLVIHRDLKPSNILAAADGRVILLDFGIAKLTAEGLAAETELTILGGRALTPHYASPEQISGKPLSISSDVYSLGVLLFELLTGTPPYRPIRASRGALEEAILHVDPKWPSQAGFTSEQARCRNGTVKKLSASLRGDLDTIVLKALKKNPDERYATVDAFRQDIERHLSGHTVLAKSDSVWYRARTFIVRNRLVVTAACAVFAALLGGIALSLYQAGIAKEQARIAQQHLQTAEAVQAFMEDLFESNSSDQIDPQRARKTTARELLDLGSEKIKKTLDDAPAVKLRLLKTLSHMYRQLDMAGQSSVLARERVKLARTQFSKSDVRLAAALVDLGDVDNSADLLDEGGKVLEEAAGILDRAKDFTSPTRANLDAQLAYHYFATGNTPRALRLSGEAVGLLEPQGASYDLAYALWVEAIANVDSDRPQAAEQSLQHGLALGVGMHGQINSLMPQFHSLLGFSQNQLGKFKKADSNFRQGVQLLKTISGGETPTTLAITTEFADFLLKTSRLKEAMQTYADARPTALKLAESGDPSMAPQYMLTSEARALIEFGRIEAGLAQMESLRALPATKGVAAWIAARMLEKTAEALIETGDHAEASRLLTEAAVAENKLGWAKTMNYNSLVQLQTRLLLAQGKTEEASRVFADFRAVDKASHPILLAHLEQLVTQAEILLAQGRLDDAAEVATKVLEREFTDDNRMYLKVYEARASLIQGQAYLASRRASQALAPLRQAVAIDKELYDPKRSLDLAEAEISLANCHLDLGARARAMPLFTEIRAIFATHPQLAEHHRRSLKALQSRFFAHSWLRHTFDAKGDVLMARRRNSSRF